MELSLAEIIKTIIIGIVEGITEWLPISSTGHMIIVDEILPLNVSEKFRDMFLVIIQLGAILAVAFLNFSRLNPFSRHLSRKARHRVIELWQKTIVASVPAAVIGLLFNDFMEAHLMTASVVAFTLILYGILFIIVERYNRRRLPRITKLELLDYRTAVLIGVFQVLALVPGTSRSGATILGGILCGASRLVATEFTFFLAIPVMLGASLLKIVKFGFVFSFAELAVLFIGLAVAFIVSIIAIKFLLSYIKRSDFTAFGWYRIALGLIVFFYLAC